MAGRRRRRRLFRLALLGAAAGMIARLVRGRSLDPRSGGSADGSRA